MIRLRRSLLFVPGDDERKIAKALASDADVVLFDLEDGVAPERKTAARETVAAALRSAPCDAPELAVRVNPVGAAEHAADVEAVVAAGTSLIVLPKAGLGAAAESVARDLDRLDPERIVGLLPLLETPAGVAAAATLVPLPERVVGVCFGHADFCREMGLAAADAGKGIAYHARCQVALAARAHGREPIDTVYLDLRDSAGCRVDAELGRDLGYAGKLCLHPAQVDVVNEAYTPSAGEVDRARELLAAWQQAERDGRGVVAVAGTMVDAPIAALSRRLVERAERVSTRAERRKS